MTAINSVIAFAMVPALPFGGWTSPGSGGSTARTAPGVHPGQVHHQPVDEAPVNLTSFGRTDADLKRTVKLVTLLHGRREGRRVPEPGTRRAGLDGRRLAAGGPGQGQARAEATGRPGGPRRRQPAGGAPRKGPMSPENHRAVAGRSSRLGN